MKLLLMAMAILEMITALALISMPNLLVTLLLGVSLSETGGIILGRIAGLALASLALGCWLSRNDTHRGLIMTKSMIVYNIGTVAVLGYANLIQHLSGIGLWPAVLVHLGLGIWCMNCTLFIKRSKNLIK